MFERILIAVDQSDPAAQAVEIGSALAGRLGAQLALVHVVDSRHTYEPAAMVGGLAVPPAALLDDLRQAGRDLLAAVGGRVPAALPREVMLREGTPADEVLAAAREWDARLIVMGTHGRAGLARLVLGSVAEAVLRAAPCPVLAVRAGEAG